MLCRAVYAWNNTDTKLYYRAGLLSRIDDPGTSNVDLADTDFGYAGGLLTQVRDPRLIDAIAAGVAANDETTKTVVSYTAGKAASLILAAPAQGAARPAHSYEYVSATETRVRVAGLSEPNGYGRKVTFDDAGRTATDTDATARATTQTWDDADRLLAVTDPA